MSKQLTTKQITERLAMLQPTGSPRSALNISRESNIPCATIKAIEHRALRKIRPLLERASPTLYEELREMWYSRTYARSTPERGSRIDLDDLENAFEPYIKNGTRV